MICWALNTRSEKMHKEDERRIRKKNKRKTKEERRRRRSEMTEQQRVKGLRVNNGSFQRIRVCACVCTQCFVLSVYPCVLVLSLWGPV